MKTLWKYKNYIFFLSVLILVLKVQAATGLKDENKERPIDIYDLSLDENLQSPIIPATAKSGVKQIQYENAVSLKKQNYNVELIRDGEIIVVTIQAGQIFNPNDTIISDLGSILLTPMKKFLEKPGMYKMLLVMHGDNSGSEKYILNLTRSRVNAVFDWFDENSKVDYVVPYALGASEPIKDNSTVVNRRQNRRLEIFIIPEQKLITTKK